jgi:hypothetical protein
MESGMDEAIPSQCDEGEKFNAEAARQEEWILSECSPDEQGRERVQI